MHDKDTISFRTDPEKKSALDAIASSLERDRSYVINQALSNYIELYEWQVRHIRKGLRQADRREFAAEKDVKAVFAKFRKR